MAGSENKLEPIPDELPEDFPGLLTLIHHTLPDRKKSDRHVSNKTFYEMIYANGFTSGGSFQFALVLPLLEDQDMWNRPARSEVPKKRLDKFMNDMEEQENFVRCVPVRHLEGKFPDIRDRLRASFSELKAQYDALEKAPPKPKDDQERNKLIPLTQDSIMVGGRPNFSAFVRAIRQATPSAQNPENHMSQKEFNAMFAANMRQRGWRSTISASTIFDLESKGPLSAKTLLTPENKARVLASLGVGTLSNAPEWLEAAASEAFDSAAQAVELDHQAVRFQESQHGSRRR